MTLDELQLRVMAAFPSALLLSDISALAPGNFMFWTLFPDEIIEGAGAVRYFCVAAHPATGELITKGSFMNEGTWRLAAPEITRRILNVSAHDLIAARRRLLADAHP